VNAEKSMLKPDAAAAAAAQVVLLYTAVVYPILSSIHLPASTAVRLPSYARRTLRVLLRQKSDAICCASTVGVLVTNMDSQ
jgi:hypothetical protein